MSIQVWRERAQLSELQPVLDPADTNGLKNQYIDYVHRAALTRYFVVRPTDRVLDFGCGIGRLSGWLAKRSRFVIGLDVTPEMLGRAAARQSGPNLAWACAAGNALPWASASFDKALAVFVLQHLLDQTALLAVLTEVARLLKPGGQFAVIEQIRRRTAHTQSGYICQRTVAEYVNVFHQVGLVPHLEKSIRIPSPLNQLISRGWVSQRTLPGLAALDTRIAGHWALPYVYADRLFILEKQSAMSH